MKLVSFIHENLPAWGLLDGHTIAKVSSSIIPSGITLREWLATHSLGQLERQARTASQVGLEEVALLPPIPDATKIICVGLNYRDHVLEMGREMPQRPVIFTRFADTLVGHTQELVAPSISPQFDYEGELAVVIGQHVRNVSPENARAAVLGYSVFNDGSIRDYQRHTHQFTPGKNFPRSGAMGPALVTADEVDDITASRITTTVNGTTMQSSTIDQLVFGIEAIVSYVSEWTDLRPGDTIATGTPGGVGDMADPQLWLTPGSVVEVNIEGVGTLTNSVVAE